MKQRTRAGTNCTFHIVKSKTRTVKTNQLSYSVQTTDNLYSYLLFFNRKSLPAPMGNTTTSTKTSELKEQVSRLGNRLPFGDDEIIRIARCFTFLNLAYRSIQPNHHDEHDDTPQECNNCHYTNCISRRFLTDWAVFSSTLPPADPSSFLHLLQEDPNMFEDCSEEIAIRRNHIQKVMDIIESHILPPNLGQQMYESLFALLTPTDDASDRNEFDSYNYEQQVNDVIAMKRIEQFLDGAAMTSRRGSRKALACIYKCCLAYGQEEANAKDLVDLAYRCSLSTLLYDSYFDHVRACQERESMEHDIENSEEGYDSDSMPLPPLEPFDPSLYFPQEIGMSLVQSLMEYAVHDATQSNGLIADENNKKEQTNQQQVSLDVFMNWAEQNAPCLSSVLESFIHRIFFPDKPYPPSRTEFSFPRLRGQHSAFFTKESSPLLFTFASMSNSLGGAWHRLYTSDSDGLSFNRLQNALLGYSGPTLLIIKEAETGGTFGAMTTTAWKESKSFYGNSDCFLFRIHPSVKVMRPRGVGENFMYCNSISRSRGYDGQAHGIGFGGTTDKPRLFISENWDDCMASAADLTFEAGSLLPQRNDGNPSKLFDLESLEVWGVGGDEAVAHALGDREKQREIIAANIRKARKVDKAQFVDDLAQFGSKTFQHRDQIRGRADCHISNKDMEDYIPDS